MKKISRNTAYLIVIFTLAALLLVYFMPADSRHKYSYELNRPWSYDLLTAPFDIPVYRDSATVNQLIDSIDRTFVPIFKTDDAAQARVTALVRENTALPEATRRRLLRAVNDVYMGGVINSSTAAIIADGNLQELKFNVDNVNVTRPTEGLMTQRDAYVYIDSVFRNSPDRAAIQKMNLANVLNPNVVEDERASRQYRENLIQPIVAAVGVVQQGERIIDRGDRVSPQLFQVLKSYEATIDKMGNFDRSRQIYSLLGKVLFVSSLLVMLVLYFNFYYPDTLRSVKRMTALMVLMVAFFIFGVAMQKTIAQGLYIVPFAIIPVVVQVFFDSRTAFFTFVAEVLLCGVLSSFQLEFIFIELLGGTVVVFSLKELSKRSQLLRSALFAFISYVVSYAAVEWMTTGSLVSLSGRLIGYFAINAVLISFAYILIFIYEKLFGLTSVVTLVELSDINTPLLRELSRECPGTFQHSMAVSNLASEAAHRIGANVQLVRAGALYHDIGKIDNPAFYTENQYGINPHDALSPEQSARIIVGHVRDGVRRADKAKLPGVIKDFILQHHGTGLAKYFYAKEQQLHPGEEVDKAAYSYPGPNPQSREASLLMMADAVEAASRALSDHSEKAIAELVDRIIDNQVAQGLHSESPLSFRDISQIKDTFIKRLRSMYHGRVSYPPEAPVKPAVGASK